jgi:hypothetical protein
MKVKATQEVKVRFKNRIIAIKKGQILDVSEDQVLKLIQTGKFTLIEDSNLRIVRQCLMNKGFHRTCLWGELLEADGKVLTICRSPQGGCRLRLQNKDFTTLIELKERRE